MHFSSVLTNECRSAVPGLNVLELAVLGCSWRDMTGRGAGGRCLKSTVLVVQAQSCRETLSGCTIPDLGNGSLCGATMEDAYRVLELLHTPVVILLSLKLGLEEEKSCKATIHCSISHVLSCRVCQSLPLVLLSG